jgi:hypothetical protein
VRSNGHLALWLNVGKLITTMTPELEKLVDELVRQIQEENDQKKFIALVQQLNRVLSENEPKPPTQANVIK